MEHPRPGRRVRRRFARQQDLRRNPRRPAEPAHEIAGDGHRQVADLVDGLRFRLDHREAEQRRALLYLEGRDAAAIVKAEVVDEVLERTPDMRRVHHQEPGKTQRGWAGAFAQHQPEVLAAGGGDTAGKERTARAVRDRQLGVVEERELEACRANDRPGIATQLAEQLRDRGERSDAHRAAEGSALGARCQSRCPGQGRSLLHNVRNYQLRVRFSQHSSTFARAICAASRQPLAARTRPVGGTGDRLVRQPRRRHEVMRDGAPGQP